MIMPLMGSLHLLQRLPVLIARWQHQEGTVIAAEQLSFDGLCYHVVEQILPERACVILLANIGGCSRRMHTLI